MVTRLTDSAGEPIPVDVYRAQEEKSFRIYLRQQALDYAVQSGKSGGLPATEVVKTAERYHEFLAG